MNSLSLLVTLVDPSADDSAYRQSFRTRRNAGFFVIALIIIYGIATLSLWVAWNSINWWWLWIGLAMSLYFLFILWIATSISGKRYTLLSNGLLRELLAQPSDNLLPLNTLQPVPAPLSLDEEKLGPFESIPMHERTRSKSSMTAAILLLVPLIPFCIIVLQL